MAGNCKGSSKEPSFGHSIIGSFDILDYNTSDGQVPYGEFGFDAQFCKLGRNFLFGVFGFGYAKKLMCGTFGGICL